jgi:hypothetical protein
LRPPSWNMNPKTRIGATPTKPTQPISKSETRKIPVETARLTASGS